MEINEEYTSKYWYHIRGVCNYNECCMTMSEDYYNSPKTSCILEMNGVSTILEPYILDSTLTYDEVKEEIETKCLKYVLMRGGLQDLLNYGDVQNISSEDDYIIVLGDECEQYEYDIRTIKHDGQEYDSMYALLPWCKKHIPTYIYMLEYYKIKQLLEEVTTNPLYDLEEDNPEQLSSKHLLANDLGWEVL